MSYSPTTHILTASLELPGVKREHLRVSLGTAYFNRVRYVSVVAESWPVFSAEYVLGAGAEEGGAEGEGGKAESGRDKEKENIEGEGRSKTPASTTTTPAPLARKGSDPWLQGIQELNMPKSPAAAASSSSSSSPLKGVSRVVNPNLRERRFGVMRRVIQVPESTTVRLVVLPLLPFSLFHLFFPRVVLLLFSPPSFRLLDREFLIGLAFFFFFCTPNLSLPCQCKPVPTSIFVRFFTTVRLIGVLQQLQLQWQPQPSTSTSTATATSTSDNQPRLQIRPKINNLNFHNSLFNPRLIYHPHSSTTSWPL
ncbi:hypothetical protein GALMADRAFT_257091 [Galerina marginata CBS 339.88]|uniref:Uncharacterized protein n=1 Tax=Galerina marginata (strain CBS 339.88) TaxID=685588 RepID=A0A067SEJ3_GALM3|nr:hypothetical protein GALMADRAFT_257091 [Galerina marginata CBS 339.88]